MFQLPVGTNLLNDIRDVLVLFRLYPVTLVTDITKMFFNIFVPENQRKYLRFVFNGVVYESFAFPFGLRISPYVASICLKLQASGGPNRTGLTGFTGPVRYPVRFGPVRYFPQIPNRTFLMKCVPK